MTAMEPVGKLYTTWITALGDNLSHAVTDEAVASSVADGNGSYETICGDVLLPLPMVCPPGRPCPRCIAVLRPHVAQLRPSRRRWFARIRNARHHGLAS